MRSLSCRAPCDPATLARACRGRRCRASCPRPPRQCDLPVLAGLHAGFSKPILRVSSSIRPIARPLSDCRTTRAADGDAALFGCLQIDRGVAHAGGTRSFSLGSAFEHRARNGVRSRIAQMISKSFSARGGLIPPRRNGLSNTMRSTRSLIFDQSAELRSEFQVVVENCTAQPRHGERSNSITGMTGRETTRRGRGPWLRAIIAPAQARA